MSNTKKDTLTARIDPALKQAVRITAAVERRGFSNRIEIIRGMVTGLDRYRIDVPVNNRVTSLSSRLFICH